MSTRHLARQLHELIAALDRRVPQLGRDGESSIARDAAALKAKALKRLSDLREHDTGPANGPQRNGHAPATVKQPGPAVTIPATPRTTVSADDGDVGARPPYPADAAIYWRIRRRE